MNSQTTPHEWIHYAREPRSLSIDVKLEEGYRQKCNEALHFAIGDAWVQASHDWKSDVYTHKYRLVNFNELKLLEVSRSTVVDLLPLPLGQWGPNWQLIRERGYDGVYIHHDDLYCDEPQPSVPPGYGRWRVFAHNYDIDTVVVWSSGKLEELVNDWPPADPDVVERSRKLQKELDESRQQYDKERAAKMATMNDEERRALLAEEKRLNRLSWNRAEEETRREVEFFRNYFIGYDEHYPAKPPGSPPWPALAIESTQTENK